MNNYNYQGDKEPTECQECFSSMTESCDQNFLICDNIECDEEIAEARLKLDPATSLCIDCASKKETI